MRSSRMRGWARLRAGVAAGLAVGLLATACGDSDDSSDEGSGDDDTITLDVSVFGRFGYDDLYEKYEADNPGIDIVETSEGDLGAYNQQLTQRLAAGSGAADIVAIEEGILTQFKSTPDTNFVNLNDYGAEELKDNYLPWKWEQSLVDDFQIGLGTDVGGLAMCYRQDLFGAAGLPTDRAAVSELWPTWEDYIEVGRQFKAATPDANVNFVDAATNTYNSILMQEGSETYFNKDEELIIESNPSVKSAWDTSLEIVDAGLSAKLKSFSDEWNAGFKNGAFATIACPAWMTGYIKGQAGDDFAGKWDIASVPGGGGNWGGSFLAVTKQSEHPEEAAELVKFLTNPDGQLAAFEAEGNLPSAEVLYDQPALKDATNEYFNNAPIGQIFVAGAAGLKPVFLGSKNQPVRDAVENSLRAVEQGQISPDEGWQNAVNEAKAAAR